MAKYMVTLEGDQGLLLRVGDEELDQIPKVITYQEWGDTPA